MQCYERVLQIPYAHTTEVLDGMRQRKKLGLLGRITERQMKYFGHATRHNSLEKDVMIGPMPGLRRQGGQQRQWLDDRSL